MSKIFKYSIYILLLLLYIYSIKFTFLPVTGKVIMAGIGLLLLFADSLSRKKNVELTGVFGAAFVLMIWGFVVVLANGTDQFLYVTYFISIASAFFASYFIVRVSYNDLELLEKFLFLISITVLFESIITIAIRYSTSLENFLFSIQEFQTKESSDRTWLHVNRFIGLGEAVYFGVLPSCAIGLTSTMGLLVDNKYPKRTIFLWSAFVIISIVSFLVARYSIAITVICILWYIKHQVKSNNFFKIIIVAIIGVFVVIGSFVLLGRYLPEEVYVWAFEFLEGGTTDTTETVFEQLFGTHFDIKTLFIGDGLYVGEKGGYHGGKDIGYFRQIFYSGLIGLFLVFHLHWNFVKMCRKYCPTRIIREITIVLLLSYFVTMIKGDKPFFDVFMLILVYLAYSKVFQYKLKVPNKKIN